MKRALRFMATVLVILVAVGCASVGKNFNYKNRSELRLGVTNRAEAEQLVGKPLKSASISNNDGNFEVLKYVYAHGNLGGAAARAMFLEFRNGILNALTYNSGFAEDSTAFDIGSALQVKRGISSKADVLSIMGEPSGKAHCPSTLGDFKDMCSDCVEVWAWIYTKKSEGLDTSTIKSRTVKVAFDDKGVATDIRSTEEH
jgi:hypothetical protein